MLEVVIYYNMSRNTEDWTKMRAEEYSSKLYLELHTVIADQFFTEILNLTIFSWIMKAKSKYVILVLVESSKRTSVFLNSVERLLILLQR
jgi:hypothetical protein